MSIQGEPRAIRANGRYDNVATWIFVPFSEAMAVIGLPKASTAEGAL